jgi:hypothetical protein
MDLFSYIPVLIAGASAIVAALLNTEIKQDDPTKRTAVFRRPTTAGWFLIALTMVSTGVAVNIERGNQVAKKAVEKRSSDIQQALTEAKEDAIRKGQDLADAKTSLAQALTALDSQAKFAQKQAALAANRAQEQSLDLSHARADLQSGQKEASKEIQEQQDRHQAEIKSQQELIEASLLGQQTERPQVALLLGTTYTPTDEQRTLFDGNQVDGGLIASMVLGDLFERVKGDSVMDVHGEFAALKPTVRDPTEETVDYRWTVWLQVKKAHKTDVLFAGGGPNELIAPKPTFELRTHGKRLVLFLESRLKKPVSSALLFLGPSEGQQVASLQFGVGGFDETTMTSLTSNLQTIFVGGEEWTLLNSSSGICALATLEKPTIKYDEKTTAIEVTWHVKQSNRLAACPADLFFIEKSRATPNRSE